MENKYFCCILRRVANCVGFVHSNVGCEFRACCHVVVDPCCAGGYFAKRFSLFLGSIVSRPVPGDQAKPRHDRNGMCGVCHTLGIQCKSPIPYRFLAQVLFSVIVSPRFPCLLQCRRSRSRLERSRRDHFQHSCSASMRTCRSG